MRILFFGTFDEQRQPRVLALREGLAAHGHEITVRNTPLPLDTDARISVAARPWRAPLLALHVLWCWIRLLVMSRRDRPQVVVVGYLGHFDVHLARLRFPRATIVLDHMVSLADTVQDRRLDDRGLVTRLLTWIDRAAIRAADVVVVDTEEHRSLVEDPDARVVVVPVGAPTLWREAGAGATPTEDREPLRVVFFGLYTPLQGAPTIGEAIAATPPGLVEWTMIGTGQDLEATRAAASTRTDVRWLDWLPVDELAREVAAHDVCLGIFGTTPKAQRVVPNKVYQGLAAGCAVVTSDTPPQRRVLGDAAVFVPPGDASRLAETIAALAHDRTRLRAQQAAARALWHTLLEPRALVAPLDAALAGQP